VYAARSEVYENYSDLNNSQVNIPVSRSNANWLFEVFRSRYWPIM